MTRLAGTFDELKKAGRKGLVAYVTANDPDRARSDSVLRGIARGGADVIEVGVPFSDPVADGPAIQRASERALASGGRLATALEQIRTLRQECEVPTVLFTYVNPVIRMGLEDFARRAAEAGVDGVLLLDLPIEESGPAREVLASAGLDQIFLISPTTSEQRLAEAARLGQGFLYAISRLGVTGTRSAVASSAAPLVERIRAASALPVALGFGISRPEHCREVWEYADAAVVGSALVTAIAESSERGDDPGLEAERLVRWLKGQ